MDYFLASPPDHVQLDWNAAMMMMQQHVDVVHHHSDLSDHSPNSSISGSAISDDPVPERRRFEHAQSILVAQKKKKSTMMREMVFRMAAMQQQPPVHIEPPKRRNVRISKDPQSTAARQRRERISERIRILQSLVPGGAKMDTASMLDEAVHYLKFLKTQLRIMTDLHRAAPGFGHTDTGSIVTAATGFSCSEKKINYNEQQVFDYELLNNNNPMH